MIFYEFNNTVFKNYLGNYWDDYSGNDTDSNGIGDEPYNITDGINVTGKDFYPLMHSAGNFSLTSIPDLSVLEIITPDNMKVSKEYKIQIKIANTGNANATSFNVSLKAGNDMFNKTVDLLKPDENTTIEFSWKPSKAKSYILTASVRLSNEFNKSNNTLTKTVSVSSQSGGNQPRGGGGGGGGGGLPLPTPTPASTPEPTPKRTIILPSIPISMPKTTPAPEETPVETPEITPTPEEAATPEPTPAWWEQPTGSIAISVTAFSAILVIAYLIRRK